MRERGWRDLLGQDLDMDKTPPCPFLPHPQSLPNLIKCYRRLTTLTSPTMMGQAFTNQGLDLTSLCWGGARLNQVTCLLLRPPDRPQTPS